MRSNEFLKKYAKIVDKRLMEILLDEIKSGGKINQKLITDLEKLSKSSEGGKRIRGSLVIMGYLVAGGGRIKDILDASVAFELFQTAILAQDDIIDKSELRRGKKSLYKQLGGGEKGVALAICLSDLGIFSAFNQLNNLRINSELKIKATRYFSDVVRQTVYGEMLDIKSSFLNIEEEDIKGIALLKTAKYTVSGPLVLGAILGEANTEMINKLQKFGDYLGTAYQINDDIDGVFGDAGKIGKSVLSDAREGKATILTQYVLRKGKAAQIKILKENYGVENTTTLQLEEIREVFIESGALKYAQEQSAMQLVKAEKIARDIDNQLILELLNFFKRNES